MLAMAGEMNARKRNWMCQDKYSPLAGLAFQAEILLMLVTICVVAKAVMASQRQMQLCNVCFQISNLLT